MRQGSDESDARVDDHHWWYRGRRRIIRAELDRYRCRPRRRRMSSTRAAARGGPSEESRTRWRGERHRAQHRRGRARPRRGLGEVRRRPARGLPWEADRSDLITCLDVIEHVPDDRVTLAELWRVSRPGGFLLVTVPAYQALWPRHDAPTTITGVTSRPRDLARRCSAGWKVERLSSFNNVLQVRLPPCAWPSGTCPAQGAGATATISTSSMAQRRPRASTGTGGELAGARRTLPGGLVAVGGPAAAAGGVQTCSPSPRSSASPVVSVRAGPLWSAWSRWARARG